MAGARGEGNTLSQPTTLNLGFLTVLHEANGYVGGYLVTNLWGRPLEFRLSTAVQPNRVQQILYAGTLTSYVCGELIGRTLVEKTAVPVQTVLTDTEAALDLRLALEVPVAYVAADATKGGRPGLRTHPHFPADAAAIEEILARTNGLIDLNEPFVRIREAIGEARKLGVASRA